MRAAIIAAGQGERLRAAGYAQPKPLVPVHGQALIDYALGAIAAAGIGEVACIVNEESVGIEQHCRRQWPQLSFEFIRRTTASSMESLITLAPLLGNERFVLLTVDSIFAPDVLRQFLQAAAGHADAEGVLAVTRFVEDEKPLWVQLDDAQRIVRIGPAAATSGWITAGFYTFETSIFRDAAMALRTFTALRQLLGHLVDCGYRLYGEPVGKAVDVDRVEDIATAEAFVESGFVA